MGILQADKNEDEDENEAEEEEEWLEAESDGEQQAPTDGAAIVLDNVSIDTYCYNQDPNPIAN